VVGVQTNTVYAYARRSMRRVVWMNQHSGDKWGKVTSHHHVDWAEWYTIAASQAVCSAAWAWRGKMVLCILKINGLSRLAWRLAWQEYSVWPWPR
jgi:hypothetical protein